MSLKIHRKDLRSLFVIFAALTAIIWSGVPSAAVNAQTPRRVPFDFTGDGRTDWATIAIPSTAGQPMTWKVEGNPAPAGPNAAFIRKFDYGFSGDPNNFNAGGDEIVAADYTGDRKTDPTVWRASTGIFYEAQFPTGPQGIMLDQVIRWGASTDNAREGGDYDGDGKADYTVVRVNKDGSLTWYILMSATGVQRVINFGSLGGATTNIQIFPGADFTGDGRDELVLVSADTTTGVVTYYIGDAVTGRDVLIRQFGSYNDDFQLAPADYTGDGKADFVSIRQTTGNQQIWYINDPVTNTTTATPFGIPDPAFGNNGPIGDLPVRGDYDGDGKADICVWRPSNQTFYYLRSSSNNTTIDGQQFGDAGDVPLGTLGALF